MTSTLTAIPVGVLAPSEEDRALLRGQLLASGVASVSVEVGQYCASSADWSTRRFTEARPEIIFVDLEETAAGIKALQVLHSALPEAWLFVTSPWSQPELIIEAMREGAREYLLKPILPSSLSQALSRYLKEKERAQQRKSTGKVYCVTGAKGGSGATSLTINLATSLTEAPNARVALIDLNSPMGDAAAYLNLRPQYTISDALAGASRLDSVLLESYMTHSQTLAVLPGPKELWPELPPGVSSVAPAAEGLAKLLEVVSATYAYSLIDLASSLDKHQIQTVVEMASGIVVVLTPELPALWRTQRLFGFLATCGGSEKLHVVINRSRRTDAITEAEIEKALNHPVFWKLPNDYNASIEAINSGIPLVSNNHSELSASYRELAYRLAGIERPRKRRGLTGLLSLKSRKN